MTMITRSDDDDFEAAPPRPVLFGHFARSIPSPQQHHRWARLRPKSACSRIHGRRSIWASWRARVCAGGWGEPRLQPARGGAGLRQQSNSGATASTDGNDAGAELAADARPARDVQRHAREARGGGAAGGAALRRRLGGRLGGCQRFIGPQQRRRAGRAPAAGGPGAHAERQHARVHTRRRPAKVRAPAASSRMPCEGFREASVSARGAPASPKRAMRTPPAGTCFGSASLAMRRRDGLAAARTLANCPAKACVGRHAADGPVRPRSSRTLAGRISWPSSAAWAASSGRCEPAALVQELSLYACTRGQHSCARRNNPPAAPHRAGGNLLRPTQPPSCESTTQSA